MSLRPSSAGGRRKTHARTVTRFCDEAQIEEADQVDLAEFILAAHYLGAEATDEQLMQVFMEMESRFETSDKNPKELIKDFLKEVEDKYGVTTPDDEEPDLASDQEVMMVPALDAFGEDSKWQDQQLTGLMTNAYAEQNLGIAKNLLASTALSLEQISDLTGVSVGKLEEMEEAEESLSEEFTVMTTSEAPNLDRMATTERTADPRPPTRDTLGDSTGDAGDTATEAPSGVEAKPAVVIQGTTFNKSVGMTTKDMASLTEIVSGGADKVAERKEEALALLMKLRAAVEVSPQGMRRMKTARRLMTQVDLKVVSDEAVSERKEKEAKAEEKEKLPAKYRVVIHPGALIKAEKEVKSKAVGKVQIGAVVVVEEIDGRRARISAPVFGWCSLHSADSRTILQREGTKSALMEKAKHADRARQTKLLILKSITTLNDATVERILEKSDWNLRRAIEAFYIAKYKTQAYIKQKEEEESSKQQEESKGKEKKKGKKKKARFWHSWKTFAANN